MIVAVIILALLAGVAKALTDLCSESAFYKSKLVTKFNFNPKWWHRSEASGNKWKNGDKTQGETFWGSSRWFVMFTDGWHLMDALKTVTLVSMGVVAGFTWYVIAGLFLSLSVFELMYSWLKK